MHECVCVLKKSKSWRVLQSNTSRHTILCVCVFLHECVCQLERACAYVCMCARVCVWERDTSRRVQHSNKSHHTILCMCVGVQCVSVLARTCSHVCTRACVCIRKRDTYICVCVCVYVRETHTSACVCVYMSERHIHLRVCVCICKRDTYICVCVCVYARETHTSCRVQQSNASGHTILCAFPTVQSWIFSRWNCEGCSLKLGWLASARPRLSQLLFFFECNKHSKMWIILDSRKKHVDIWMSRIQIRTTRIHAP